MHQPHDYVEEIELRATVPQLLELAIGHAQESLTDPHALNMKNRVRVSRAIDYMKEALKEL